MKQYTNESQTAKLIGLGFDKPKSIGGYEPTFVVEYEGVEVSNVIIGENKQYPIYAYSIGELIEMLPKKLDTATDDTAYLEISWDNIGWRVDYVYFGFFLYTSMAIELIDTLYDMCVKLKEEGVI